ncbi:ABC transporter ATP-binding protein [Ornithinimicrobium cerasi]|uniref:Putative ABC transport system ATP-binding protein n=1 Tax=Ornithinimicrobium cerasi TaxID=2248773 RepID=A0A285VRN2_9MICO|nr:ABC transporter ATP-binding protein [Ornithinimicrobium cerasi]SOC56709.1 putative ABC transport system ATP-binding protein [Ornithinimicrobium cerasi]
MTTTTPRRPAATLAASALDLTKTYGRGEAAVRALDGVSVGVEAQRFTAIMGPSGSGKSTLMHLLAGLDTPTSGRVFLGGTELTSLSDRQLTTLRRRSVGFVFQAFNLLPTLTALQNVRLPLDLAGTRPDPGWERAVVEGLGLADRLDHRPGELSGGQQQRVALARALVTRPEVIFADEPTGALDSTTGAEVLDLLRRSVDEWGQTVVMVTHDATAAAVADRVVLLADGRVAGEIVDPDADAVLAAVRELGRR